MHALTIETDQSLKWIEVPEGGRFKPGDAVRLKIATLKRPAGYSDESSTPNNARKVTSNQNAAQNQEQTPNSAQANNANNNTGRSIKVSVPGQEDVFIGDGERKDLPIKEVDVNVSVLDQPSARRAANNANQNQNQASQAQSQANNNSGSKTARFRYQVPPLVTPMDVRIELTDPAGRRTLLNRQARSGENISLEAKYDKECLITIFLGGEMVGQQRYR